MLLLKITADDASKAREQQLLRRTTEDLQNDAGRFRALAGQINMRLGMIEEKRVTHETSTSSQSDEAASSDVELRRARRELVQSEVGNIDDLANNFALFQGIGLQGIAGNSDAGLDMAGEGTKPKYVKPEDLWDEQTQAPIEQSSDSILDISDIENIGLFFHNLMYSNAEAKLKAIVPHITQDIFEELGYAGVSEDDLEKIADVSDGKLEYQEPEPKSPIFEALTPHEFRRPAETNYHELLEPTSPDSPPDIMEGVPETLLGMDGELIHPQSAAAAQYIPEQARKPASAVDPTQQKSKTPPAASVQNPYDFQLASESDRQKSESTQADIFEQQLEKTSLPFYQNGVSKHALAAKAAERSRQMLSKAATQRDAAPSGFGPNGTDPLGIERESQIRPIGKSLK
jgi:hypothetical protein